MDTFWVNVKRSRDFQKPENNYGYIIIIQGEVIISKQIVGQELRDVRWQP